MRILALMILGLMVAGCGKTKTETEANTKTEPLSLEEKVVGTYEAMYKGEVAARLVISSQRDSPRHPEGFAEFYANGKKLSEAKWSINKDGELHLEVENGNIMIHRANDDGSLTMIAMIQNASMRDDGDKPDASEQLGKRKDIPKEKQLTYKKIK